MPESGCLVSNKRHRLVHSPTTHALVCNAPLEQDWEQATNLHQELSLPWRRRHRQLAVNDITAVLQIVGSLRPPTPNTHAHARASMRVSTHHTLLYRQHARGDTITAPQRDSPTIPHLQAGGGVVPTPLPRPVKGRASVIFVISDYVYPRVVHRAPQLLVKLRNSTRLKRSWCSRRQARVIYRMNKTPKSLFGGRPRHVPIHLHRGFPFFSDWMRRSRFKVGHIVSTRAPEASQEYQQHHCTHWFKPHLWRKANIIVCLFVFLLACVLVWLQVINSRKLKRIP
jgi:hypothetical protein